MSDETSVRLGLPLLQAGQAQKELSHNEALTLLDLAVQPVVEAVGVNAPPTTPTVGACWVIGPSPSGAWSGHAHAVAGWTGGGWRFLPSHDGIAVWSRADGAIARFDGTGWIVGTLAGARLVIAGDTVVGARRPAISAPTGGTVSDVEARATIADILAALRTHGLIAT